MLSDPNQMTFSSIKED